jgi:hypothetical protein
LQAVRSEPGRNGEAAIKDREEDGMSDLELAKFLGIAEDARWPQAIARLDPKKRAAYERMADVCMEIDLYEAGLGPKPQDVILCYPHGRKTG